MEDQIVGIILIVAGVLIGIGAIVANWIPTRRK